MEMIVSRCPDAQRKALGDGPCRTVDGDSAVAPGEERAATEGRRQQGPPPPSDAPRASRGESKWELYLLRNKNSETIKTENRMQRRR